MFALAASFIVGPTPVTAHAPHCALICVSRKLAMRSGTLIASTLNDNIIAAAATKNDNEKAKKQFQRSCEKLRTIISRHVPPFFTYIELFAGVGGFGVAAEKLGGRCVFASELEHSTCKTWQKNFGGERNTQVARAMHPGDVRAVPDSEIPPASMNVDLLVGGFPCQPFTRMGDQPATSCGDGNLYKSIVKFLDISQPKVFLLENVPGIISSEDGDVMRKIGESLDSAGRFGYDVITGSIDSVAILPQYRMRIYFIGFRRERAPQQAQPRILIRPPPQSASLVAALAAAAPQQRPRVGGATAAGAADRPLDRFVWPKLPVIRRAMNEITERDPAVSDKFRLNEQQWKIKLEISSGAVAPWMMDLNEPALTLTKSYRRGPGLEAGKRFLAGGAKKDDDDDGVDEVVVQNTASAASAAAPATATTAAPTNPERPRGFFKFIHTSNGVPRFLTHREGARMQGFPETFWISEEFENHGPGISFFGNAVSPPVIAAILHSALTAANNVSIIRRFECSASSALALELDLKMLVSEMLLEAVPSDTVPVLRSRLKSAAMRDVVAFAHVLAERE